MKNKRILSFSITLFMGVIIWSVSIFGIKNIDTMASNKNNINFSDNIAIVNQDLGVDGETGYINYSEKIIETLDEQFTVTSREVANKGLDNGKYSAIVIFPGTFSKNTISINNENPEKVQFYYEISPMLPKDKRNKIESRILTLERNVNDKISYLYIATILNEFHRS